MKIDNLFWGVSFTLYGVVLCLSVLGIIDTSSFVSGWSLFFIIIPCLFGIALGRYMSASLVGLFVSVFLLFLVNGLINFWIILDLIIPFTFIFIGICMIKKLK